MAETSPSGRRSSAVKSWACCTWRAASRSSINREDKSWQAQGIDVRAKVEEVTAKDARVGLQLALQATFGLRARESMQLRPNVADNGSYLALTVGTKGGRDRVIALADGAVATATTAATATPPAIPTVLARS